MSRHQQQRVILAEIVKRDLMSGPPTHRSPSSTDDVVADVDDAESHTPKTVSAGDLSPRLTLPGCKHQLKGAASQVSDATWKLFRFMQERERDDALPGGIVKGASLESSSLAGLLLVLGGRTRSVREGDSSVAGRGTLVIVPDFKTMHAWSGRAQDDIEPPLKRIFQLSAEMELQKAQDFLDWTEAAAKADEDELRNADGPLGGPLILCKLELFVRGLHKLHHRRNIYQRVLSAALNVTGRIIFDEIHLPYGGGGDSESVLFEPWKKLCQERPVHASTSIFFLHRDPDFYNFYDGLAKVKEMLKIIAPFDVDSALGRDRDKYLLTLRGEASNGGGSGGPRTMQATAVGNA